MISTDDVVRAIVADAAPVRPLLPPFLRALGWFGFAVVVVAVVALSFGLRADLSMKLREPAFALELAAVALTGAMATIAAFHVSLPDQSGLWLLLPAPPAVLWLFTVGYGCLANWVSLDPDGLAIGMTLRCFTTVVLTSIPLAGSLFLMLRHAGHIRPSATAGAGCLAVAALTAGGLRLFHDLDATVLVLAWSLGLTGLFVGLGCVAGGMLFSVTAHRQAPQIHC